MIPDDVQDLADRIKLLESTVLTLSNTIALHLEKLDSIYMQVKVISDGVERWGPEVSSAMDSLQSSPIFRMLAPGA